MLRVRCICLALAIGLADSDAVKGQMANNLVGCWTATVTPGEDSYVVRNGDTVRFRGHPSYLVTYRFKPDGTGSVQWGSSSVSTFAYRLVNSAIIEFRGSKEQKASRASFFIKGNTLSFREFPAPTEHKEEISLLYTLHFIKQP